MSLLKELFFIKDKIRIKMKILKKINANDKERVFFIGDIHGEYDQLVEKLMSVSFSEEKDILIFVGDLVDRGPKIKKLLDLFLSNEAYQGVIGNHDNMMFNFCNSNEWITDERHGGNITLKQLGNNGVKKYKKLLMSKLTLILEIEINNKKIGVIHGGIPFDKDKPQEWNNIISKAKRNKPYRMNLLWDRSVISAFKPGFLPEKRINGEKYPPLIKGIDFVIHGHTRLNNIENYQNRYYIDTFKKEKGFDLLEYDKEKSVFKAC